MHKKSQHLLFIAASWFSLQILCSMDNPVCCDKPAYSGCISACLIWLIFPPMFGVNSYFRLSVLKNMKGNVILCISYDQFRYIYVTVEDCSQAQHVTWNLNKITTSSLQFIDWIIVALHSEQWTLLGRNLGVDLHCWDMRNQQNL